MIARGVASKLRSDRLSVEISLALNKTKALMNKGIDNMRGRKACPIRDVATPNSSIAIPTAVAHDLKVCDPTSYGPQAARTWLRASTAFPVRTEAAFANGATTGMCEAAVSAAWEANVDMAVAVSGCA